MDKPWSPHGPSNSGLVRTIRHAESRTVPAVATYRGRIWCLWTDLNGKAWYAVTGDKDGEFERCLPFLEGGRPTLTNLNGHLHAVVALVEHGQIFHCLYDEEDESWDFLNLPSTTNPGDYITDSTPCLTAFHNKVYLSYLKDGVLYYAVWMDSTSDRSGCWSGPWRVSGKQHRRDGIPAFCVLKGVLYLLCPPEKVGVDKVLCYSYDDATESWSSSDEFSSVLYAEGISTTTYGDTVFLGFNAAFSSRKPDAICVVPRTSSRWGDIEWVSDQKSSDPPRLTVLNGRLHCIFASKPSTRGLHWFSRPLYPYSIPSWMASLPTSTPISSLTIPGTHDSCARSNIPFVRTQYLSITQQLQMGIRFLDLRLRLSNSTLYLYHGGVPLGLPRRLTFSSVLTEIFTFLRGPTLNLPATETILISIANDDPSPTADPSPFYHAVSSAISSTSVYPDNQPAWYTSTTTPFLSTVRGRAVLLRRYLPDPSLSPSSLEGIDLSSWINDSPRFTITTASGTKIHIQDKWHFTERIALDSLVNTKSEFVRDLMVQAVRDSFPSFQLTTTTPEFPAKTTPKSSPDATPEPKDAENEWYINFCSAVGDPSQHGELAQAKSIAVGARPVVVGKWVSGVNTVTKEFLAEALVKFRQDNNVEKKDDRRGIRLGIVNMDYPELPADNDIVAQLIALNFDDRS